MEVEDIIKFWESFIMNKSYLVGHFILLEDPFRKGGDANILK